ncbi:MAG TPA: hypothetical protein VLS44_02550 [Nitrospira sp.]|nr:hypothetical protein [Nitrospira sp.]
MAMHCGFDSSLGKFEFPRSLPELTGLRPGGYAPLMRSVISLILLVVVVVTVWPAHAIEPQPVAAAFPDDEYRLYDEIIASKFLTSGTSLVLIERMTTTQLSPKQEGLLTMPLFQEQGYFDGGLPTDLVREFVAVNQTAIRLEGRFQFGARYRFVSGNTVEEPEVSLARPVRWEQRRPVQALPVLDRLVFSRVAYNLRQDQALVYVGNPRPDGSGAGFLVWFRRRGMIWAIYDTEVIWTVRIEPESDGGPLLAP